ncbi:hypothetical protein [Halpernia sp. GG3]
MSCFIFSALYDKDILPVLQEDFILVSLYVEDKEAMPEDQQILIEMGNDQIKKVKTFGDRWSLFQWTIEYKKRHLIKSA